MEGNQTQSFTELTKMPFLIQKQTDFKGNINLAYSNYGYIKFSLLEYNDKSKITINFFQVKPLTKNNKYFSSPLTGKINKNNIHTEINVKVKTFYGKRKIYNVKNVGVMDEIKLILNKITDIEKEIKNEVVIENKNEDSEEEQYILLNKQFRVFKCRNEVIEINPYNSFFEEEINDGDLLIYLPPPFLSFSETMHGNSISLSQDNLIASKVDIDDPQYILGNTSYTFGKHYFEINLLTEPIMKSVIIGVAVKRDPNSLTASDVRNFYGHILSDAKKIQSASGKQEINNFGECCGINDIFGVLVEFKENKVEVSFYKNKIKMGMAFGNLAMDRYFPAVCLGLMGTKVRISGEIEFPEEDELEKNQEGIQNNEKVEENNKKDKKDNNENKIEDKKDEDNIENKKNN